LRGREAEARIRGMLSLGASIEAVLFAAGESLSKKNLRTLLGGVTNAELIFALRELEGALEGRGLALIETDEEVELRTASEAADIVKKLRESELSRDLGKASLETLAVIAYKAGSTRTEIDWVRGVNSGASMRTLLLRGLIEGVEDPSDKRRIRYSLTPDALAHLGISRAGDLPRYGELSVGAQAVVEANETAVEPTT
jgi:segregation and condensation protein B